MPRDVPINGVLPISLIEIDPAIHTSEGRTPTEQEDAWGLYVILKDLGEIAVQRTELARLMNQIDAPNAQTFLLRIHIRGTPLLTVRIIP